MSFNRPNSMFQDGQAQASAPSGNLAFKAYNRSNQNHQTEGTTRKSLHLQTRALSILKPSTDTTAAPPTPGPASAKVRFSIAPTTPVRQQFFNFVGGNGRPPVPQSMHLDLSSAGKASAFSDDGVSPTTQVTMSARSVASEVQTPASESRSPASELPSPSSEFAKLDLPIVSRKKPIRDLPAISSDSKTNNNFEADIRSATDTIFSESQLSPSKLKFDMELFPSDDLRSHIPYMRDSMAGSDDIQVVNANQEPLSPTSELPQMPVLGHFKADDSPASFQTIPLPAATMQLDEKKDIISEKMNAFAPRQSIAYLDTDERGYMILQGAERYGVTMAPFRADPVNDLGRTRDFRVQYLEGLRGLIGFQTLLWIFFRIFAPAIAEDRDLDGKFPALFVQNSPAWMNILRKVFSPLLFDGSLQVSMFIILSGRCVLLTFIERREAVALAGPCFRRPFRLVIPVAVTVALVAVVGALEGFKYANYMATRLHNEAAVAPQPCTSVLEFWNIVSTFFFSPVTRMDARAVQFIPVSGISWYIQVAFEQTYVLIVYAWILPFITLKYKVIGLVGMISLTAWVGRWSWYTLTGLAIAEFSVVYRQLVISSNQRMLRRLSVAGLRKNSKVIWIAPWTLLGLGVFFKYLWADAFPAVGPYEIRAHAAQSSQGLNFSSDPTNTAYPRYDNYFFCTGLLLLDRKSVV